jgi:hypothetical protein
MASFAFARVPDSLSSVHTSRKISIDDVNVRDTLASIVTTLPKGMALLNATWFTDAVTVILRECLLAAILAARSMRASNSPPKRLFKGLVSPGSTTSVMMQRESDGYFGCICFFGKDSTE